MKNHRRAELLCRECRRPSRIEYRAEIGYVFHCTSCGHSDVPIEPYTPKLRTRSVKGASLSRVIALAWSVVSMSAGAP